MYIYDIGTQVSDEHSEHQVLNEQSCFSDLDEGLSSPYPCGLTIKPRLWNLSGRLNSLKLPITGTKNAALELTKFEHRGSIE